MGSSTSPPILRPGECLVALKAWSALDSELKAIIAHACAAEAAFALAEMERLNAEGLTALVERHNVRLKVFSPEIVVAARRQATDILAEVGQRNEMARKVHDSYAAFRSQIGNWSRISLQAVLAAREA